MNKAAQRQLQHRILGDAVISHVALSAGCFVLSYLVVWWLGTACYVLGIPYVVRRYWQRSVAVSRGTTRIV